MKRTTKYIFRIAILAIMTLSWGCTAQKNAEPVITDSVVGYGYHSAMHIPRAVVYKTNGDYDNHVPVVLNADGSGLAMYPAPSDVSAASTPVKLTGGWLLDRRGGICANTAFLTYTYPEYAALSQVPTQQQLMSAIIPGAKVTETKALPITLSEALQDIDAVNRMLK